jgi:hypothetical protein
MLRTNLRRGLQAGFSRWRSLRKRVFQGLPVGLPTIRVAADLNVSKQHDFDHRGALPWGRCLDSMESR